MFMIKLKTLFRLDKKRVGEWRQLQFIRFKM